MDLDREIARALFRDEARDELKARPKKTGAPASHWARVAMLERLAYLKEMARFGQGEESELLRAFPGHSASLLFRSRTTEAELCEKQAVLYVVLAGAATLVAGGRLKNARPGSPGQQRGDGIENGTEQKLRAGDVAHVPAGVPHQMLLAGEETISCLAVRMDWTEEQL